MSLNAKQNVRCPECGQMSEITVWNSITVKDSKDLKQDLLQGKINMFHCPSCSHTALMPTPMLYHDEEKRLMISFSPCNDPILKNQLFDNVQKTSKESGELEKLEGYNLRFITDYNELLEKITDEFRSGFIYLSMANETNKYDKLAKEKIESGMKILGYLQSYD